MQGQRGHSLVEVSITVALLGLVAAIILPVSQPADETRLDSVTNEIMQALRYTRDEAVRTGLVHGIEISQNTQKITVYKADMTGTTIGKEYILTHPLDKKPYQFQISDIPNSGGVIIANATNPFSYPGYTSLKNLVFDAAGTPKWTKLNDGSTYQLGTGSILLDYAGKQRSINISPLTGRVTVQ